MADLKKRKLNSLFLKIMYTVISCLIALSISLSLLNIQASKKTYITNFMESQEKLFYEIDQRIYAFYQDISAITDGINHNAAAIQYLTGIQMPVVEERQNILQMLERINQTPINDHPEINMILVGLDGRTLVYNKTRMTITGRELLQSKLVQNALTDPDRNCSTFLQSGFTDVMNNEPVIAMSRAIKDARNGHIVGVTVLTIKEADFCKLYAYFTAGNSEIVILNENDIVVSSNNKTLLSDRAKQESVIEVVMKMRQQDLRGEIYTEEDKDTGYIMQRLQSAGYTMIGKIDASAAFDEAYDKRYILLVTGIITIIVTIAVFLLTRMHTAPLSKMARHMAGVDAGHMVPLENKSSIREVRELSDVYNRMLMDIDAYIKKIVEVEKEKREAEIQSLQMQINPHYIYNTLASAKWLIWQHDDEKAVCLLDAFIKLLRNTVSNKQDRILLSQEIENLKDYVLINQIRYGEKVKVDYYILPQCENCLVPKLILQPFVENAFFHAFPDERTGTISVFARVKQRDLLIEIIDDGVGIEAGRLSDIVENHPIKSEHFTGIGVHNVDNRIKLLYGDNYGITIESHNGHGTKVSVRMPYEKKEAGQMS